MLPVADLARVGELARDVEAKGYHRLLVSETRHDPFLALAIAAEHTAEVQIGTCIAVAFPRSPMHLAQVSHDLQAYSRGRFILGLGSPSPTEVKHRFGVEWSRPAARMREIVLALRAIWRCWNDGTPLQFEGEFYRHTLMTPAFDPGPTGWGPPQIFLAAGDEEMVEVAGEVADGIFLAAHPGEHSFGDVLLPALERGLRRSDRSRADIEISVPFPHRDGDLADRIAFPIC